MPRPAPDNIAVPQNADQAHISYTGNSSGYADQRLSEQEEDRIGAANMAAWEAFAG
jgi:hypothetical protein